MEKTEALYEEMCIFLARARCKKYGSVRKRIMQQQKWRVTVPWRCWWGGGGGSDTEETHTLSRSWSWVLAVITYMCSVYAFAGAIQRHWSICRKIWKQENQRYDQIIFVSKYLDVSMSACLTAKKQYRKFETNISRKEIARPHPQFPHSCVCERFIYVFPRSVCLFCCKKICGPILGYINRSYTHAGNWDWGREFLFWEYINGIFVAVCCDLQNWRTLSYISTVAQATGLKRGWFQNFQQYAIHPNLMAKQENQWRGIHNTHDANFGM